MGQKQKIAMRVVVDTNVFISAVLFGGEADKILSLGKERRITILISKEILEEYIRVLAYPKFSLNNEEIKSIIGKELLPFVTMLNVNSKITYIKDDPEDDKFLSLAVDGKADYIVSGDKHLLGVKKYKNSKILTIQEFLAAVY